VSVLRLVTGALKVDILEDRCGVDEQWAAVLKRQETLVGSLNYPHAELNVVRRSQWYVDEVPRVMMGNFVDVYGINVVDTVSVPCKW
jgi:hypothetical protein